MPGGKTGRGTRPVPKGFKRRFLALPEEIWAWIDERAALDDRQPEAWLKRLFMRLKDNNTKSPEDKG